MRKLFLLAIFGLLLALLPRGEVARGQAGGAGKPGLTVYLQQDRLREGEDLPAVVWISNELPQEITDLRLSVDAPAFLAWWDGDCQAGQAIRWPLSLDPIPAHTTLSRRLCARIQPPSDVGSFNLLFTVVYRTTVDDQVQEAFVSSEKKLAVDVFGADNIIGVPLAFAGLILPGLFFWLVLRLAKVPYSDSLDTEEKLVLSVFVSIVIIGLGIGLRRLFPGWALANFFDISSTISVSRLIVLALSGLPFGLAAAGIYYLYLARKREQEAAQQKREAARAISINDPPAEVVRKILDLNADYHGKPVVVKLKGKKELHGAHYGRLAGRVYVAGAFRLRARGLPEATRQELRKLVENGNLKQDQKSLLEAIKLTGPQNSGRIEELDLVKEKDESGVETSSGRVTSIPDDAFISVEEDETGSHPLLSVDGL